MFHFHISKTRMVHYDQMMRCRSALHTFMQMTWSNPSDPCENGSFPSSNLQYSTWGFGYTDDGNTVTLFFWASWFSESVFLVSDLCGYLHEILSLLLSSLHLPVLFDLGFLVGFITPAFFLGGGMVCGRCFVFISSSSFFFFRGLGLGHGFRCFFFVFGSF